jgi:hypothetical protein
MGGRSRPSQKPSFSRGVKARRAPSQKGCDFRGKSRVAKLLIFVTREGRRQSAAPTQANDHGEIIVSGIADGAAYDAEGRIVVVVDWNSDVDIDAEWLNSYRGQLRAYQQHTGAPHAFLVLMTPGKVIAAKAGGALRRVAFSDRAFVPLCPIGRFIGISTLFSPAWRRQAGVSFAEARELEQRHQPPLPARVAVDVALRDLYRLVTGQQLNVAQAAAGLVRVSRRRGNEAATAGMRRTALELQPGEQGGEDSALTPRAATDVERGQAGNPDKTRKHENL